MKRQVFFFGVVVLLIAAIFTMAGCEDSFREGFRDGYSDGYGDGYNDAYGNNGTNSPTNNGTNNGTNDGNNNNDNPSVVGTKPSRLSETASYTTTLAKLNEIITYCENNQRGMNSTLRTQAQNLKPVISNFQSSWSTVGSSYISTINSSIIDNLQ